jgi:ribosomal protein S18 acetylase RimI-like enzyme
MVTIQKGLPPNLVGPASELVLSALWEKFVPILGDDSRAIEAVASSIAVSNCFCALEDNALVGLLALQTQNKNFLNFGFDDLYARYGFCRAVVKGMALHFLQHKPRDGELYVEGVAVIDAARGKGVGTQLFQALMNFTRARNYDIISLEVIDTNIRALHLYERLGFRITKRTPLWPANKLIGWPFMESILMEYAINSKQLRL